MISFKPIELKDFIKSYSPTIPTQDQTQALHSAIQTLLREAPKHHKEKSQEQEIGDFLKSLFSYHIRSRDNIDLAVLVEDEVNVIIEIKAQSNQKEFITSPTFPLAKALSEAIFYFLKERHNSNNSLKHIIICTFSQYYIYDAQDFRQFQEDKKIKKLFISYKDKTATDPKTQAFYDDLQEYLKSPEFVGTLPYTHFSLHPNLSTEELSLIYQLLSPQVLLKSRKTLDANTLNKGFYEELLYILGLKEVSESGKSGGKIIITPSHTPNSLSDAIAQAYELDEESTFTLITTWNNRILFLALLESMLLGFKHISIPFLQHSIISDFATLQSLFFEVLAKKTHNRSTSLISEFASIPYLNSSLFDRIALEREGKSIGGLASLPLQLSPRSILRKDPRFKDKEALPLLEYLFEFLHAYDFTTTPKDISHGVKQNHDRLINSAVLGLVFEKLNGYKEGSFYTPSFITSYMCKQSITQALIDKYNATYGWEASSLKDIISYARSDKIPHSSLLSTLLSLRICDPAVGSGHFLVSALNEMVSLCYELGLLTSLPLSSTLELENDEILIKTHNELFTYTRPSSPQEPAHQIQVELFNLKKSIIENCLFGVDINPNSCEITKLRLWIELLKYSYYLFDESGANTNALETLPNIDINIKCGNSLISRFSLDDKLNKIKNIKKKIQEYKELVASYKNPDPLHPKDKTQLENKILELKVLFSLTLKDPKTKSELEKAIKTHIELYNDFALDDESLLEGLNIGAKNLFGTPELSPKEEEEAFASYGKIRALRKKLDSALSGEEYKNAFEWRFEFPEVLDEEGEFKGFDCIIGNPPYIRIQGLDRATSKLYQKTFSTASQNYDIYVLFVEKCLKLLSPNAQIAFIMPHKWLNSLFGAGLRELTKDKISKIISFGHYQIFDVSTYTALQWFKNKSKEVSFIQAPQEINLAQEMSRFLTKLTPSDFLAFPTDSLTSSPWYFGGDLSQNLFSKVTSHTPLKEIFSKMFQGIATSKDSVYFLYDCVRGGGTTMGYSKELERNVEIENALLKPLLMGDSFHRYDSPSTELRVLFPYYQGEDSKGNAKMYLYDESTLKERFPKGYAYLKECEKVLRARENGRLQDDDMWWRYIYPKNQLLFGKEKLLCPDFCEKMQFTWDKQGEFYFTTTIYGYIKNENFENLDYRFLLAVLNSELTWWYLSQVSSVMRGGYYRNKPTYMQDFSIPNLSPKEQEPFIKLVDEILEAKEQNPQADTQKLEEKINSLAYALYGIDDGEISIIKGEN